MPRYKELMSNIKYGNENRIKKILSYTNIDDALVYAAKFSDIKRIKYLINLGANVNYDEDLLSYVIDRNEYITFNYLVEKGSKINNVCLDKAIENNNIQFIKQLINNGCIVTMSNLRTSIVYTKLPIFKLLLDTGIDMHKCDDLLYLCLNNLKTDIIEYLLKNNYKKEINEVMLLSLYYPYKFDITKLLFENGADIHFNDDEPIKTASELDNKKAMMYFIDDVDVNMNDNLLIKNAVFFGDINLIECLIKRGCNTNINVIKLMKENTYFYETDLYYIRCILKHFNVTEELLLLKFDDKIKKEIVVYFRSKKIKQIC